VSIFRRRAAAPAPEALNAGYGAGVTVAGVAPVAGAAHAPGGQQVRGWAGLGVQLPANYAGAYSGSPVSMRGGFTPGLQRRGGTECMSAGWYTPPTSAGTGQGNSWQGTLRGGASAGAQLVGGSPAGSLGPSNVRAMRQEITAAQIRQSGLAAVQWAQSLSPVIGS
jgi:hypothetical protein